MYRIYVAGAYSVGDVAVNVRTAMDVADELLNAGFAPYCPHLTHFLHMHNPHTYETWCALDNEFVTVCDGLLRMPGESKGADAEVALARANNIPVYSYGIDCQYRNLASIIAHMKLVDFADYHSRYLSS